jgi:hypothetical protein
MKGGIFVDCLFVGSIDYTRSIFGANGADEDDISAIADFRLAWFNPATEARLMLLNRGSTHGFRARFIGSNVKTVHFVDVHWHKHDGRIVLQDELDLSQQENGLKHSYEEVSSAYRQLIGSFEASRAYDKIEDCQCGVIEMRRLDPSNFIFGTT